MVHVGNRVWNDTNNDGLATGEIGVNGVVVELYRDTDGDGVFTPGVDTYIMNSVTTGDGNYEFTNLPETTGPTTRYFVVITGSNFLLGNSLYQHESSPSEVPVSRDSGDDNRDHGFLFGILGPSANPGYVASTPVSLTFGMEASTRLQPGDYNPTVDFGFWAKPPTSIDLAAFEARALCERIELRWQTVSESNVAGFDLLRSQDGSRSSAKRITPAPIAAQGGSGEGFSYSYADEAVKLGVTYTYWLVELGPNGPASEHGPAAAVISDCAQPNR